MPTKVMMPLALLLGTVIVVAPAAAQVPVNDAARTDTETRTRVCMTRARTFKQASVSPSRGVTVSVTSSHDTAGIAVVSGQSVFGATFSGTTIAGSEFQVIAAVVGSIAAIKTDNVGQVLNSLAAVASATRANIVRFIRARETYDPKGLRDNYDLASLYSTSKAADNLAFTFSGANLQNPVKIYGPDSTVTVSVKSVIFLNEKTAAVRFSTTRTSASGPTVTEHWVANVRFRYTSEPMRNDWRFDNPLGFQVTEYRRDQETVTKEDGK